MKIVAFDPGETTGICYLDSDSLSTAWFHTEPVSAIYQLASFGDVFCSWYNEADLFVVENFRLYSHKALEMINNELIACRVIGALEVLAVRLNKKIVYQMAAQAKPFVTDRRLELYNLYTNNKHERDATRHALYYLIKNGHLEAK